MPITLDGTLGITTPALTVTGATVNTGGISTGGNLTFTTAASRIIGVFDGTTANRVMFQTSTTNANTFVGAIPNGTAVRSGFFGYSSNDPANSSVIGISVGASATSVILESGIVGTGSYLPLTFYTGGSERMRIDTSGNVGIGTTTAAQKLQIGASTANDYIQIGATSLGYVFGRENSTGEFLFNATQASPYNVFKWQQGGTERMRISAAGNVGIYNNAPSTSNLLTVGNLNGVSRANIVTIQGSSSVDNYGNCIEFGHSNSAGYRSTLGAFVGNGSPFIGLECEGGTTGNTFRTRGIAGSVIYTDNAGAMLFGRVTNNNADNQTVVESMRIDSAGNVAIGRTSSISYKLDVEAGAGSAARLLSNNAQLLIGFNSTSFNYYDADTQIFRNNAGSERMRIDSSGNVQIGITGEVGRVSVKTATAVAYNAAGYNGTGNNLRLISGGTATTGTTAGIAFGMGGAAELYIGAVQNSNTYADAVFQTYNGSYSEKMRISAAGQVTMPFQPAFCVGISGTVTATGVMVFNVTSGSGGAAIFFNRGGHYNSSNGRFTAPVAGAYQFNFMALLVGPNGGWVEVNTLLNGTISQQVRRETINVDNTTVNFHTVVYMNANDYFQISIAGFQASSNFQANDSRIFNSFSGSLLG
jgi:hypothetical protein